MGVPAKFQRNSVPRSVPSSTEKRPGEFLAGSGLIQP
jgi:hypothetical protein